MLVFEVLDEFSDASSAKDYLRQAETRRGYRQGNFVVLDPESAWHIIWDRGIAVRDIGDGVYVVTNLTLLPDIEWTEQVEMIWRQMERRRPRALELARGFDTSNIAGVVRSLMDVAADHGDGKGPGSICYHNPTSDNLQSSSTLIAVSRPVSGSKVYYCAGNPCEGEFREYSHIFRR